MAEIQGTGAWAGSEGLTQLLMQYLMNQPPAPDIRRASMELPMQAHMALPYQASMELPMQAFMQKQTLPAPVRPMARPWGGE